MSTSKEVLTARLDGKLATVTGAERGTGGGVALGLGARGASIIVNYSKSAAADDTLPLYHPRFKCQVI